MGLPSFLTFSPELQKRIRSAGLLIPPVLFAVMLGGFIFNVLVLLGATLMCFEWNNIIRSSEPKKFTLSQWEWIGISYVTIFAASLLYLRQLEGGAGLVLLLLILVWATDIAAYFAGRFVGGPKICPKISPNKTWAGLIGGAVAAGFVGAFASVFFDAIGPFSAIVLGIFLAVVEQAGDFFESWVKRQFGVKDSGALIPGHGGIMDRVDGMVTVTPILALIVAFY